VDRSTNARLLAYATAAAATVFALFAFRAAVDVHFGLSSICSSTFALLPAALASVLVATVALETYREPGLSGAVATAALAVALQQPYVATMPDAAGLPLVMLPLALLFTTCALLAADRLLLRHPGFTAAR
jgi:hypothetical protein